MTLMIRNNATILWHDVLQDAEQACHIHLEDELEVYLINLLMRYANKPELVKQLMAMSFLDALHAYDETYRNINLQCVGDQCLLFTGLFPRMAARRRVSIAYFVHLGQSAYTGISQPANDLFISLSSQFVLLMDVLQSIRQFPDLLPLEAYEQWQAVGSQRALKTLEFYTRNKR